MSKLTDYFERLLRHNEHDEKVDALSFGMCSVCHKHFYGLDETDLHQKITRHSVFQHDQAPAEDDEPSVHDDEPLVWPGDDA